MKMASATPRSVDDYLSRFPPDTQRLLGKVRRAIRQALPRAEEAISYGMPTYRLEGRYVIYFAGWKQHFSIYPADARLLAAFGKALAPYEVNGRGTVRFPLEEPVPTALIARMAKFRATEAASAGKPGPRKKR
jgi:uncharacterized protein YdhG (YjbR/CyaY superfamily)